MSCVLRVKLASDCVHTFIDLTSVMSFGLRVFKADMAASRAGIASAKSPSHSSLIA